MTQTLRAILLMILSMALLAASDAFLKLASSGAPLGQVMFLVSFGGTLIFWLLARLQKVRILSRDALHPMVLLRSGIEIIAAIGIVVGVANVSLPVFAAIMQAGPLLVTLGAALFLGESVGWRRWIAVLVGMVGMLIVIRPFGTGFTGWELFAVIGICGLSARDLVTRLVPQHLATVAISAWGFAATIPTGILFWILSDRPAASDLPTLALISGAVLSTSAGYLAVTAAMRLAPASTVSPYRYARLIFATGLGIAVFSDWPDGWTLIGSALILGAGLFSFLREAQLARQTRGRAG
jgi:drug/metabolite transporter (DMT)-like permease